MKTVAFKRTNMQNLRKMLSIWLKKENRLFHPYHNCLLK